MDIHKYLQWLPVERLRNPPPVVAALRLTGVIGGLGPWRAGLTLQGLAESIERAFQLPRLAAVALQINSPGGSPVQASLIASRIRTLAEEKDVRVLAFVEDLGASGGYWLACAADEIWADRSSVVGSIGVIAAGFGFQDAIARLGIERRLYTAGNRKALLDPFLPENPEDVAHLKTLQAEIHESFKDEVRRRRAGKLKGSEEELFSGAFWTGARAQELGLVDGLGEMRAELRRRFGQRVVIRPVQARQGLLRRYIRAGGEPPFVRDPAAWGEGLIAALESRALWSRYGL